MSKGEDGRPQSVTTEQVLKAIAKHQTTNQQQLAKILNCSWRTILRRMQEAGEAAVQTAIGSPDDQKLTPQETEYTSFLNIPKIAEFAETYRYTRKTGKTYVDQILRSLYRVCLLYNKRPTALTLEDGKALMIKIVKGENKDFGEGINVKKALRSWFGFMNIANKDHLTNLGLDARVKKADPERARTKLTQEMRHAIREAARKHYSENWSGQLSPKVKVRIPFAENPSLAYAMDEWFEFKYYTGTRKIATLNACWEQKEGWGVTFEKERVIIKVTDKGRRGGHIWEKKLLGEAKTHFEQFYEAVGKPTEGKLFPFTPSQLECFLKTVYAEANIPPRCYTGMLDHIWRHTAAQDLLAATEWNVNMVAATLGWDSTEVLKQHYGEIPPEVAENMVKKAMGMEVIEVKKEFKF